jgi:hypothetical protein
MSMTVRGRVQNGVVVLPGPASLPEGTLVDVTPVAEPGIAVQPEPARPGPPYAVSEEQRKAILGLIGCWKMDNPPDDGEVERIIDEHLMKKYG